MDSVKNYTQNGYTDQYAISNDTNPLVIPLRKQWLNQQVKGIRINTFVSGYGSLTPTSWVTVRLSFYSSLTNTFTQFYAALDDLGHNHQTAFIIPYDSTAFRHIMKTPVQQLTYFSDTPCYFRNVTNDYIQATFYDESNNVVDFNSINYFITLSVDYGAVNKYI